MLNNCCDKSNDEDFVKQWIKFFNTIENSFPKENGSPYPYETLKKPLKDIIKQITSKDALDAVNKGINYLEIECGDKAQLIIGSLLAEMNYVITLSENDTSEIIDVLSSAKNVKESLEKIFKLPEWLKKILHLLNELLSLIKP